MINFIKFKRFYFLFSLLFLLPSIYFLSRFGLKPALDFTGGSLLEVQIQPTHVDQITTSLLETTVKPDFDIATIQQTSQNTFIFKAQDMDQEQNFLLKQKITDTIGDPTEISFQNIGPTLGKELIKKTLAGIALSSGFILLYVAYQFKDKKYGACAILAMLHDTLILLGTFSFLGLKYHIEVDALFVTAVLTILSFSVHDTIVVYDRIRETLRQNPKLNFTDVVNKAITETLGRSINNSLTIIFMLLSLFMMGGESIKWFVFALLIGTISGTYSSTFTAAPLLVLWEQLKSKRQGQTLSAKSG
ncbi:protein translocase subunit SecF [Patescibacteria group bacterium]